MRIVLDLQAAQGEGRFRRTGHESLALALAIIRNCGEHEIFLALNGLFPKTIEPIRAIFDAVLPQENIRVWHAPGPVRACDSASSARRAVAERIREAFLAELRPDIVLVSSLFDGYSDESVTSIGVFAPQIPTCVILDDLIPLLNPETHLAPNPTYARHYVGKIEQLKRAATCLFFSAATADAVRSVPGLDTLRRVEFLTDESTNSGLMEYGAEQTGNPVWDIRARRAIALFAEIHASQKDAIGFEDNVSLCSRLIESIAPFISCIGQRNDLAPIAQAIATSLPEPRNKQLFIDVSGVVLEDAKTGIQRVTRSILKEFLDNPPDGYTVEPVYATPYRKGYRYARHYTACMLSQNFDGEDEQIDYRPGDLFLGLDLQHRTLINQRDYLTELRQNGVKVLFVGYDLLPISMPHAFVLEPDIHTIWLETITAFDGALCISRAVADELLAWLAAHGAPRLRPFRINWFHLGADIENSVPTFGLPDDAGVLLTRIARVPSFLMVGTVEPRKGHLQTLDAFEQLWARGIETNLVIVGKQGWNVDALVMRLRQHPQLGTQLFWFEGISDEYLEKIYAAAVCLVAASEGEGFGLPLIEAARHKLPIIARDLQVFREVADKHALYFDGLEPERLAATVEKWLSLAAEKRAPQSSGIQWLTWTESATQLKTRVCGNDWYRQWPPEERRNRV